LKELGKELGLAHSTVSGIVDRLGQKGLVERKTDEADLRFTRIVPTEAVRNFLKERWPSLESQPLAEALGKSKRLRAGVVRDGLATLRRLLELGYPIEPLISYHVLPTTTWVGLSPSGDLRPWGALRFPG
jgi:MarR family transcriptional regulator, organic hydroperoxide resistance regulator